MGIFRPPKTSSQSAAATAAIESEIREAVKKTPPRHSRDEGGITADVISDGVKRIAGEPLVQIGRMIAELTHLRDHLRHEAERVQDEIARLNGEIAGYTHMSEAAVQSIRAMDRAVGEFKGAAKPNS